MDLTDERREVATQGGGTRIDLAAARNGGTSNPRARTHPEPSRAQSGKKLAPAKA